MKLSPARLCFSLALLPLASLCPTWAQTAAPQAITKPTFTVLHSFTYTEGDSPQFSLTVGADGALYGVAPFGGLGVANDGGGGTVFKVTQGGVFHKLADFYTRNGIFPSGPLLLMPDGSLMGVTSEGGKSGTGALFLLTPPHRFQTKHEFASTNRYSDNVHGAVPVGALALGPDGAVYGTTVLGGPEGRGVVYRWTPTQGVEVLHSFAPEVGSPPEDGSGSPAHGLTLGPDGALYGATFSRGFVTSGTVYRITTDGLFTTLHVFHGQDGANPLLPVLAPDGTLYGTTAAGGKNDFGVAYRITPDKTFSVLHTLTRTIGTPSGLTMGPDGNLYGTTTGELFGGIGIIFRLSPSGQFTALYTFSPGNGFGRDGTPSQGVPLGGVTFGPDGALYGTTFNGGQYGTIFRLRLPQ